MGWSKENIRTLRLRLGWSQCDLARRLHTETNTIDLWEVGSDEPEPQFQEELELLFRQASVCSAETQSLPGAELACESSALDQIDFSCVKENLQ
ncbi:MAG: XRE family transcriptional regulator [Bdellovibrionaceae bacterium]|nr:XRE family transcriptional regulator [Pseudobdellovibrionaceae bacterium]